MGEWTRVRKGDPCPICGSDTYCAKHATGWAKCMRRPQGSLPETNGWTFVRQLPPSQGEITEPGYRWDPPGGALETWSADDAKRSRTSDEAKRKRNEGMARRTWGEVKNSASIDGGQNHPNIRRYIENRGVLISWLPGAALPGSLRYHPHTPERWNPKGGNAGKGAWEGSPAMIAKIVSAEGEFSSIHRTYLDPVTCEKRSSEFGEAKKKLGTSKGRAVILSDNYRAGVLIVTEGIETGLACLASVGSRAAVWAFGDTVSMLAASFPAHLVAYGKSEDAIHTIIVGGDLDKNEAGQKAANVAANAWRKLYPWLTVETRFPSAGCCPTLVDPEDNPIGDAKSVDWLDALNAENRDAVASALLDGIDLEAAATRAYEWDPKYQRSDDELSEESEPGYDRRFIDESALLRARRYLLEMESPDPKERAWSGFMLRRWKGRWYEYVGTHWVEVEDESLRGRVWHWLDRFWTFKRGRECRLDPTKRMVEDLVHAMTVDLQVESIEIPFYLPPSFDAQGRPLWGAATTAARMGSKARQPEATRLVAYENGLLDVTKVAKTGEVVQIKHRPRWFSTSCLPYELDFAALRDAVSSDEAADKVLDEKCPNWRRFLKGAWDEPDAALCVQEWFGYNVVPDISQELIALVQGPGGSGKGTLDTGMSVLLGDENIATTSFNHLTRPFHMAALVGKLAAIMSDAHVGKYTDTTQATEVLKGISGGDAQLIEWKSSNFMPRIRLFCRITIYVNEMPTLLDASGALADRILLIPMSKAFRRKGKDPTIKSNVRNEGPGISIWAILGLVRLLRRLETRAKALQAGDVEAGKMPIFTPIAKAAPLLEDFRRDSSPAYAFTKDCCVTADDLADGQEPPTAFVPDVFKAWSGWCHSNNRKPGSPESLGKKMRAIVPGLETLQEGGGLRRRYFVGLDLNAVGRALMDYDPDNDGGGGHLPPGGEPIVGPPDDTPLLTSQAPAPAPEAEPTEPGTGKPGPWDNGS